MERGCENWGQYFPLARGTSPGRLGEIAYIGEKLAVYTGGVWGWQRLRWWSGGVRLVMRDLTPGEQEARRIYLRERAKARRGRAMLEGSAQGPREGDDGHDSDREGAGRATRTLAGAGTARHRPEGAAGEGGGEG